MDAAAHVKTLLLEAMELPVDEREAFVAERSGGDGALRDRVLALLRAQEAAGNFMDSPTYGHARAADTLGPGAVLAGRYTLVERVGEGGFGVVWRARQSEPVQRDVALKILLGGVESERVLRRFEGERQAMALMTHPGVARVYDAGATPEGRPFFVMELVPGPPITQYCADRRLEVPRRLELFIAVCRAVQHAHQKGIIHRDIKPSNVLVAEEAGEAQPKVIDFGVARAIGEPLAGGGTVTLHGQVIGTPGYMSPEQASGDPSLVDTRSDVYSLGVLLYELLTGVQPFDAARLAALRMGELEQVIRDEEPPRPSSRVLRGAGGALALGELERERLSRTLRQELDWIVMRAIAKDPERRYPTASVLAADVQRYLNAEPVEAGPPTFTYRFGKLTSRYKWHVRAAGAVAAALALGAGGTVYGLIRAIAASELATAEAMRARAAEAEAARRAEELGRRAAELGDIVAFEQARFTELDPSGFGEGVLHAVREAIAGRRADGEDAEGKAFADELDRALAEINPASLATHVLDEQVLHPAIGVAEQRFAERPQLIVAVWEALAQAYLDLGLFEEAADVQRRTAELAEREFGPDSPRTAETIGNLGVALSATTDYAGAEQALRRACEILRRTGGAWTDQAWELELELAHVLLTLERPNEAETLARRVLGEASAHDGAAWAVTRARALVGHALKDLGRFAEAEPELRAAVAELLARVGPDSRETLRTQGALAALLYRMKRFEEAGELYAEILEHRRAAQGHRHPETIMAMGALATCLVNQGELERGETLHRETLALKREVLGETHMSTLATLQNLAAAMYAQGRLRETEETMRQALAGFEAALGPDTPSALLIRTNLGVVLFHLGRPDEGEAMLRDVVERGELVWGPDHPALGNALAQLGAGLKSVDRYRDAEAALLRAHQILAAALGEPHREPRRVAELLVELYESWAEVEPGSARALAVGDWKRRAGHGDAVSGPVAGSPDAPAAKISP